MALGRNGHGATAACAAAVAAVLVLSMSAAAGPADAASHLAGMRLDGLAAGGHAIVLEFTASGEEGRAAEGGGGEGRPGTLVLEEGLVRTGEGPRTLGGPDARVMVTGGGTVVVYSADSPAVVLAVPERAGSSGGGGGEDAGRYTVTAYVPRSGGGSGFEAVSFDATIGPRSESDAPAPDPADAAPPPDDAGAGEDGDESGGLFPDDLAVAMTVTERVQFGGTLVVQGRVYDGALNDRPAVVPIGPGAVPGVPVQVTVTDRRTGADILDHDGMADQSGLFRAEYRWKNTDPAATLDISVSIDGGRALEKRTAFYLGDAGSRGSRSD